MSNQQKYSAGGSTPRDQSGLTGKANSKWQSALLSLQYAFWFFVFLLLLEVLEEFVGNLTGWFLWNVIPKSWDNSIAIIGIILSVCLSLLTDKRKEAFSNAINRPDEINSWEHMLILLKKPWAKYISHNTLLFIIICAAITLYLPAYCASIGMARCMFDAGSQRLKAVAAVFTPASSEDEEADDENAPYLEISTPEPASSQLFDIETVAFSPSAAGTERRLQPLPMRLRLLPGMNYKVSDEEYNAILFQTGYYAIAAEDWDDNNIVLANVGSFVEALHSLHRNPAYSEGEIPSPDLYEIESASRLERDILIDIDPTSNQLQYVIDSREASYCSFPFYSLAVLTRESFSMYGDAIYMQRGTQEDAAVLFMKSIQYGFETLQYDVSTEEFVRDLEILSERFFKLATVLAPNSSESRHAFCLSEAFRTLSREFYGYPQRAA